MTTTNDSTRRDSLPSRETPQPAATDAKGSAHTPAPWAWFVGKAVDRSRPHLKHLTGANGQGFALTVGVDEPEDTANGNLMIAAPDLLELVGFYRCHACREVFSVRTGTVMERSHIPLNKWVYAMYLLVTARKGISSMQLAKEIGVTQKTAWFLLHRLREAARTKKKRAKDAK